MTRLPLAAWRCGLTHHYPTCYRALRTTRTLDNVLYTFSYGSWFFPSIPHHCSFSTRPVWWTLVHRVWLRPVHVRSWCRSTAGFSLRWFFSRPLLMPFTPPPTHHTSLQRYRPLYSTPPQHVQRRTPATLFGAFGHWTTPTIAFLCFSTNHTLHTTPLHFLLLSCYNVWFIAGSAATFRW